jgi:Zn-dependent peptidase ImmA (M78 family)
VYYSIYKSIRDSAWQCLIDHDIGSLPVDVLQIARNAGMRVIKNSNVGILMAHEDAKSFTDGEKWFIIYNDRNKTEVSRLAIAHELGHMFLGHSMTHSKYAKNACEFAKKSKAEEQADLFALRLLCPACVLMKMGIYSPEDISEKCRIPIDAAKSRSERMKALQKRNKYFSNELETQVFENFKSYFLSDFLSSIFWNN